MTTVMKQRLVGALVLLALAVLLLPLLFSGQGRIPDARITDIPEAPFVRAEPAVETPPELGTEQNRIDQIFGLADGRVDNSRAPLPARDSGGEEPAGDSAASDSDSGPDVAEFAVDDSGEVEAWSVQLGSFRNGDNARRLLERLRDSGYQAYTRESVLSDGSALVQVMVGPGDDIEQMRTLRTELAEAFDVAPLVVRFQP